MSADVGARAEGAQLVASLDDDGWCTLNQDNLDRVIAPVRDKSVVVLSVAGAFRKGKSFLLNLFLKRLNDPENWMASNGLGLRGFPWRNGVERETTGIHLWSKPILCRLHDGSQVAVLLMDTQGIFDNNTMQSSNVKIFMLSTLLSSIQIYNLSDQIQSSDMKNLEYFAKCARHSSRGSIKFQKLVFLVRNFELGGYEFGADGGMGYLDTIWQSYGQNTELNTMSENIQSCFENIECFLMPHPGPCVSGKSEHNFQMSDLNNNEVFRSNMQQFVEGVLSPRNLIKKDVHGVMTAGKWAEFFSQIVSTLNANHEMLSPPPLFKVVADIRINAVLKTAIERYESAVGAEIRVVEDLVQYITIHNCARRDAVTHFASELGGFEEELVNPKREQMLRDIEEIYRRNLNVIQLRWRFEAQEREARILRRICIGVGTAVAGVAVGAVAVVAAPAIAAATAGTTATAAAGSATAAVAQGVGGIATAVGEVGVAGYASNVLAGAGATLLGAARMLR